MSIICCRTPGHRKKMGSPTKTCPNPSAWTTAGSGIRARVRSLCTDAIRNYLLDVVSMALDGRNQYPSPHSKAYLALKAVPDRFKQEYDSFLPLRSARLISPSASRYTVAQGRSCRLANSIATPHHFCQFAVAVAVFTAPPLPHCLNCSAGLKLFLTSSTPRSISKPSALCSPRR